MAHYRLSALGAAHVEMIFELYRSNPDGSISTLDVTEVWRHGYGFIDEDLETNLGRADDTEFYARPDEGEDEACDFKDSVAVYFEFSEDIDAAEQEDFKEKYHRGDAQGRGGVGYIHEGEHGWGIEDERVRFASPVRVEFCGADGTPLREVTLRTRQESKTLWEDLGRRYVVPNDSALKPWKVDNPHRPTKTEAEIADLVKRLGL